MKYFIIYLALFTVIFPYALILVSKNRMDEGEVDEEDEDNNSSTFIQLNLLNTHHI